MAIESKMARGPIGSRPMSEPKKKTGWIWVLVFLVVLAGAGIWYYYSGSTKTVAEPIASGDYQAVFLDNGQVYFGKLDRANEEFYLLTDVFYLQTGGTIIDQVSNLALTKLGNEAHGPEDRMQINVEHILFIEDMKDDSKVVQAIQSYKTK